LLVVFRTIQIQMRSSLQRHYCCEKQKGIKPWKVSSKGSRRLRPEAE
jgi:hypothetical protein